MKSRRVLIGAGVISVISAALAALATTAGAQSVCCNDVKFPERDSYGGWGPSKYVVVDGIGRAPGTYRTIQEGIDSTTINGQVLVKPSPDGYYDLGEGKHGGPLVIRRPLTISAFGNSGIVRVRGAKSKEGDPSCAVVALRGDGKASISGLSFEVPAPASACIIVAHAGEFALSASDITAVDDSGGPTGLWCAPRNTGPRPHMNCGLVGVLVESGVATIQGNRIRRTGTAIALVNPTGDAHRVGGNYLAGNGNAIYVTGGAKFLIEHNGIFRNHEYGVILENGVGLVADNDIEDNYTGLKIIPPSAFSGTAYAADGGAAVDYADMSRPVVRIERNLITQYGVYRPYGRNANGGHYWLGPDGPEKSGYDPDANRHVSGSDRDKRSDYSHSSDESIAQPNMTDDKDPSQETARFGYALDFGLSDGYLEDNVYDYPKRGSILSGVSISQNCFFGPATSWFDKDRFMRLIAPTVGKDGDNDKDSGYSYGASDGKSFWGRTNRHAYKENGFSTHNNDALTPLFDVNTWVEHLDYDGVDKIDHDNSIRSPRYDGFSGGMWTAIHNWFARNKKEMVCAFRFKEPVVSAPGDWPRFDTNPIR